MCIDLISRFLWLPVKCSYKMYAFWLVVCLILLSKNICLEAPWNWPQVSRAHKQVKNHCPYWPKFIVLCHRLGYYMTVTLRVSNKLLVWHQLHDHVTWYLVCIAQSTSREGYQICGQIFVINGVPWLNDLVFLCSDSWVQNVASNHGCDHDTCVFEQDTLMYIATSERRDINWYL